MLTLIIVILLIFMLVGSLPNWQYSQSWGPAPAGLLGTVLIVVLILYLLKMI